MKCLTCRGACCDDGPAQTLSYADAPFPGVMKAFFIARGGIEIVPGSMWMPGRCPQLTDEGLCGCYDDRPMVCALFTPGCAECYTAVKRSRTPEQYAQIRDDDDPETIHDQT